MMISLNIFFGTIYDDSLLDLLIFLLSKVNFYNSFESDESQTADQSSVKVALDLLEENIAEENRSWWKKQQTLENDGWHIETCEWISIMIDDRNRHQHIHCVKSLSLLILKVSSNEIFPSNHFDDKKTDRDCWKTKNNFATTCVSKQHQAFFVSVNLQNDHSPIKHRWPIQWAKVRSNNSIEWWTKNEMISAFQKGCKTVHYRLMNSTIRTSDALFCISSHPSLKARLMNELEISLTLAWLNKFLALIFLVCCKANPAATVQVFLMIIHDPNETFFTSAISKFVFKF